MSEADVRSPARPVDSATGEARRESGSPAGESPGRDVHGTPRLRETAWRDIATLAAQARAAGAWFHTDAVQALGKVEVDFRALGVHGMTLSAHKIGGPLGTGALLLDRGVTLTPVQHGGGQERDVRSGTLDAPAVAGFAAAATAVCTTLAAESARISACFAVARSRYVFGIRSNASSPSTVRRKNSAAARPPQSSGGTASGSARV